MSKGSFVNLMDVLRSAKVFVDGDWVESKDQDVNGDVRLIQLADIGDGCYIDKSSRFLTSDKARELRCTFLEKGDVLVARMPEPLGRACIFPGDLKRTVTVVDVCIIRPKPENHDARWLMHCLNAPVCRNQIADFATGTTRTRISRGNLAKIKIPLPPLEEQKRIAEILDRAQSLISLRRKAIAQLDTLNQSIFLEMFGDPLVNPKGWKIKTCKNICSRITVGIVVQPASYYQECGVPALRSQNIKPNSISTDNLVFFSQSDNETKLAKTRVKTGDVVLVRTGQPGTAAVIPKKLDGVNAIDLLITTPCKDVVDSVYFCSFLNSSWGKKLVSSSQVGQVQKHLNVGILNNAQIICPPLSLGRICKL